VGVAASWNISDPNAVYNTVRADVRSLGVPKVEKAHFEETPIGASAAVFMEQLPMYTIKPLYIALVWALHQIGFGYCVATFLIGAASFLMIGVVLALWRPRQLDYGLWLLAVMAMTWVGMWPMKVLAHFST